MLSSQITQDEMPTYMLLRELISSVRDSNRQIQELVNILENTYCKDENLRKFISERINNICSSRELFIDSIYELTFKFTPQDDMSRIFQRKTLREELKQI